MRKFYSPDVTIGARLELDANDGIKSLKDLKAQIKDAQGDLIAMQDKFGATSKEAIEAAKRVAGLRDQIKEASEVADLFDPGKKFQAVANAVNTLTGGFTALTGAMSLLGVESEEVQKQLLKVQSALALSQGLSQVADSAKDFTRLKDVLVNTFGKGGAIGIAIAGVTALGAALLGVFTKKQSEDVKAYNDSLKDYQRAAAGAIQQVNASKLAFEQARAGLISKDKALQVYNDSLGEALGKTNDFNEAEQLLAKNAQNYIRVTSLKAQANALFAKAAETSANAMILQNEIAKGGFSGTYGSALLDKLKKDIEKAKEDAKDIENLGKKALEEAAGIERNAGINRGGTKATSPSKSPQVIATKDIEKETTKVFSTEYDNRLLNLQKFNDNWLENKKIFLDAEREITADALAREQEEYYRNLDIIERTADEEVMIAERTRDAKIAAAQNVGSALQALSNLVGQQTAAGKALALAQIAIDTAVAISGAVRQATKNPLNLTGFAFVADMAARVGAILANIAQAKKILQGANTSTATTGTVNFTPAKAPIQANIPQSQRTRLDQDQLNQIGNAAVRAFVVESDVSSNQERIRRLNRAARI